MTVPKYMASLEKAFLNAFLAGMYEDGEWGAFFVHSSGRHETAKPQCTTSYQHCCVNNLARGFVNAAESSVMVGNGVYYVNLFAPAEVRFGKTVFTIGEGYFGDGRVQVTVTGAEPTAVVMLRIPEWSRMTEVKADGRSFPAFPGEYTAVRTGCSDFSLTVQFDMTPRICDFTGEFRILPDSDYHISRWVENTNGGPFGRNSMVPCAMSTLWRGALLLARSKRIGCTQEEMFSEKTIRGTGCTCTAESFSEKSLLGRYRVTFSSEDDSFQYEMCDFASAANKDLTDAFYFTVQL